MLLAAAPTTYLIRKHSPRQATANSDTTAGTSAGRRFQDDGYLERRVVIKGWEGTIHRDVYFSELQKLVQEAEGQQHRRLHESVSLYTLATEDVLARIKNFRESFQLSEVFHVDVRDLFNLATDKNLYGHVGLHLKKIRTIGQHPKLDELLTAFGRI
eukprot:4972283-Amphidinium_carterae.1